MAAVGQQRAMRFNDGRVQSWIREEVGFFA